MSKQYFLITKITKEKYLEFAEEAGSPDNPKCLEDSLSGSMPISSKEYLAYTSDNALEVLINVEGKDE